MKGSTSPNLDVPSLFCSISLQTMIDDPRVLLNLLKGESHLRVDDE